MAKITFTDDELREAAIDVRDAMLASIPAEEDCPYEFSPGFEERIRQLYQEKMAEKKKKAGHPVLRRVAAIFLATLVALSAWLAVDNRARAAVLRWFREIYENQIIYRFTGQEEAKVLPDFEFDWIPANYERTDVFRNDLSCVVMYSLPGSKTEGFVFAYDLITEGLGFAVNDSDGTGIPVEINGNKGYFYPGTESSPANLLAWVREDLGILVKITSRLSQEEIVHIASGLKLYIPTK